MQTSTTQNQTTTMNNDADRERHLRKLKSVVREARNPAVRYYDLRSANTLNNSLLIQTISDLQHLESSYVKTISDEKLVQLSNLLTELSKDERIDDGGELTMPQLQVKVAIFQLQKTLKDLREGRDLDWTNKVR